MVVAGGATYWAKYEDWVTLPAARALISAQLNDPGSAQFRDDRFAKTGWFCGELNAKNPMGGYVGFKRFISGGSNGIFYVEGHGRLGEQTTEEAVALVEIEIKLMKTLQQVRAAAPDAPIPSAGERREIASKQRFNDRWKELCDR